MTDLQAATTVGPPPGARVRLSSNESNFGPSPRAVAAMRDAVTEGHVYPDDQATELRAAIAEHDGVGDVRNVIVGTGSAQLLMDLCAHELSAGDEVLAFERSFVVYRIGAGRSGATYVEAPTGGPAEGDADGYQRDADALVAALTDRTRIVFLDNPGNPTGAHVDGDGLRAIVAAVPDDVTIVVDEAYHQYATGHRGYLTAAEAGVEHPRLLVSRTFSKAHALAGQRIGYLTSANADLLASLDGFRARFNVTSSGQAGAIASLGDDDHLAEAVRRTVAGRERMVAGLRELGIPCTDGLGNFVTFEVAGEAGPVVEAFGRDHGVGVRPLLPYAMASQVRASVGTEDEVEAFLVAADDVVPR